MHHVGHYVVQQFAVMRDHYRRSLRGAKGPDSVGDYLERVHVEAGIGLVEYAELRFQHGHLEYLVALLLSSRKAHVHVAFRKFPLHSHEGHLLLEQFQELARLDLGLSLSLASRVDGGLHEIGDADPGNLHGILEAQEDSGPRALLRTHGQKVAAGESDASLRDFVAGTPCKHTSESALAGAVGPHHGMHLSFEYGEIYAPEYLLALDSGVQVLYFKQYLTHCSCTFFSMTPATRCRWLYKARSPRA